METGYQVYQDQKDIDLDKLNSVGKIQNAFFHEFATENFRDLVDLCDCEILQHICIEGTEVPTYYIKLANFVQRIDDSIYVVANFQNLVTFIFENKKNQNSIYLVSLESFNPYLEVFTQTLKQSGHLVEYKDDNFQKTRIKERILKICGGDLTEEMIQNVGQFGGVLKTVGNIFGSVAKNIAQPSIKAQSMMQNGIHMIAQKYVSQQNKNRWNVVKQTASSWNQKATEYYRPIDNAFKWIASSISQGFNNSQNKYLKNLKKYGLATAKTLNDSYKKAQNHVLNQGKQNLNNPQIQLHQQSQNTLNPDP